MSSGVLPKIRAGLTESRSRRNRKDLIARIGELTYVQRIDPSAGHDTEVEGLVAEIRHVDLERRRALVPGVASQRQR